MKLPKFSHLSIALFFSILAGLCIVYAKIGDFDGGTIGIWDGPNKYNTGSVKVPFDKNYNDMSCDPPPTVGGASPGGAVGGGEGIGGPA